MNETKQFTPQAARRWAELGGRVQTLLLNNVWCSTCGKSTTLTRFTGKMQQGDLVLEGHCIQCDGPVARVVEGS